MALKEVHIFTGQGGRQRDGRSKGGKQESSRCGGGGRNSIQLLCNVRGEDTSKMGQGAECRELEFKFKFNLYLRLLC